MLKQTHACTSRCGPCDLPRVAVLSALKARTVPTIRLIVAIFARNARLMFLRPLLAFRANALLIAGLIVLVQRTTFVPVNRPGSFYTQ